MIRWLCFLNEISDEDKIAFQQLVQMSCELPCNGLYGAQQLFPMIYLEQCAKVKEMKFDSTFKYGTVSKQELRPYAAFHLSCHVLCEMETAEVWFICLFHCMLFLNLDGMKKAFNESYRGDSRAVGRRNQQAV